MYYVNAQVIDEFTFINHFITIRIQYILYHQ